MSVPEAVTPKSVITSGTIAALPDVETSPDASSWVQVAAELIDMSNVTEIFPATLFDAATAVAGVTTIVPSGVVPVGVMTIPSSGVVPVGSGWPLNAFNYWNWPNIWNMPTLNFGFPLQAIVEARQANVYGIPLIAKASVGEGREVRMHVERFRHRMPPKAFEAFSRLAASESLGGTGLKRHYRPI